MKNLFSLFSDEPSWSMTIIERRLLGSMSAIFFVTFIVHHLHKALTISSSQTIGWTFTVALIALAALEYLKPWCGIYLLLVLWPTMWIVREAALNWIGPHWIALPDIWGAPATTALAVGCWVRFENPKYEETNRRNVQPYLNLTKGTELGLKFCRFALWGLLLSYFISSIIAVWRIQHIPAGWVLSPNSKYIPLITTLTYAPSLILGLTILNHFPNFFSSSVEMLPYIKMAFSAIIGGIIVALLCVYQLQTGTAWTFSGGDPLAGPFFNRNTTAPYLSTIGMLSFAMAYQSQTRWKQVGLNLAGIALIILTLLTQSRNGVLMVFCMVFCAIFMLYARRRILAFVVSTFLFILLLSGLELLKNKSFSTTSLLSRMVFTTEKIEEGDLKTASGRWDLFKAGILIFRDYPWFGSGPGTFAMLTDKGARFGGITGALYSSAHSMPLNLLAENGLLGLLSWSALWLFLPLWAVIYLNRGKMFAMTVIVLGVGNLFDTVWMVPSMTTFSILLIICTCADSLQMQTA